MKKTPVHISLLFCCALLGTGLFAQDLSGTWKGNYGSSILMKQPDEVIAELFIYNDSMVTGLTHAYYKNDQYEHHKISGKYRKTDSTLLFTEASVISYWFNGAGICQGRYTMKLVKTDTKWVFIGRWKDKDGDMLACPSTSVWFEKAIPDSLREKVTKDVVDPVVAAGKNKPVNRQLTRITDIQKVLDIAPAEKDSVAIELYDNGEVDGDSVTVYLNDSVHMARLRLSDVPVKFYISLDAHTALQKLTLSAENLGSIPPNTALMVVTTRGGKRYEIHLSSSMEKNAAVEFFLTR
jgi:hypothetical protein